MVTFIMGAVILKISDNKRVSRSSSNGTFSRGSVDKAGVITELSFSHKTNFFFSLGARHAEGSSLSLLF